MYACIVFISLSITYSKSIHHDNYNYRVSSTKDKQQQLLTKTPLPSKTTETTRLIQIYKQSCSHAVIQSCGHAG